jgi:hypothetical protein
MVEDVHSEKSWCMGFRYLHCFNLAMMAKQICRLTEVADSLWAQGLRQDTTLEIF